MTKLKKQSIKTMVIKSLGFTELTEVPRPKHTYKRRKFVKDLKI